MKINEVSSVTPAPPVFGEQYFSIQDQGMIFEILRNKMYSNPISAICREISCNARDAHREVNKAHVPIEISLPITGSPNLKIKDYGPGISPDRISNVFIKYTASTKRSDNVQTGGFGLGAKTPFAYSDSFNIITNYNGVQYNYVCFIDETKVGKISLLSDEPTDQPNGTEIIVPVKSKDFSFFANYIDHSVLWWDVKPTIKNTQHNITQPNYLHKAESWFIIQNSNWNKSFKAVVDGIEYPLPLDSLRAFCDSRELALLDASQGDILLVFGVGELSLSANREQIYFDEATKNKIKLAINYIRKNIYTDLQQTVSRCSDLWQANIVCHKLYSKVFNRIHSILPPIKWNDIDVMSNGSLDIQSAAVSNFTKGLYSRRSYQVDNKKFKKITLSYLQFNEDSLFIINDTSNKDITYKHLKKFLDANPSLKSLQILNIDPANLDIYNKKFHLDKMNPTMLSSIISVSNKKASSKIRFSVYKYESSGFGQVAASVYEKDSGQKLFCKFKKDAHKIVQLSNGKYLPDSLLSAFLNANKNYTLYGVDSSIDSSKIEEFFDDATSLEDLFHEKIVDSDTDYEQVAYAHSSIRLINCLEINPVSNEVSLVKDPNSLFLKRVSLENKIKKLYYTHNYELQILDLLSNDKFDSSFDKNIYLSKHPEDDIVALYQKFDEKYPLIKLISTYEFRSNSKHIIDYINLMDSV